MARCATGGLALTIPSLAFDPYEPTVLSDPFRFHSALRDAGSVVFLEKYQCYAVARFAEVRSALQDWETFVSSRGVGLSDFSKEKPWRPPSLLLEVDPPLHARTREVMNKVASLSGIRARQSEWREKADALVALAAVAGPIDAVTAIAEAFPLSIFPDMIGLRTEGRENLIPYAMSVFNAFGPRNALLAQAEAEALDATAWVAQSCKREFLTAGGWGRQVYTFVDTGDCSEAEAERLVRSFLSAGVDTTVNGIANLLHAFAENPGEWKKVKADPSLAKRAIEESLRWGGVAQTFYRTTSRDVEIGGELIPADSKVLLFLAAANRDPRRWTDPDTFNVTRNASGHVGFGFGIHQCLGQMVARFEAEAMLGALIARVDEIRPTGPAVRRLNNTLYAIGSLPLELVPEV